MYFLTKEAEQVEIYYYSFFCGAHKNIDVKTIESENYEYGLFDGNDPDIKEVTRILKSKDPSLDGLYKTWETRLKIIYPDDVIYVDQFGGVLSTKTGEGHLPPLLRYKLEFALNRATGLIRLKEQNLKHFDYCYQVE